MRDVERVYANVKELAGQYNVSVRETLSYIRTLSNSGISNKNKRTGRIIVLCEKTQERRYSDDIFRMPTRVKTEKDTSAYMGSPLKDDCTIDAIDDSLDMLVETTTPWDKNEEYLKGIPQVDAAKILSAMAAKVKNEGRCEIWAICEKDNRNAILTFRSIEPDQFHRGCAYFHGQVELDSVQVKALMDQHLQYIPTAVAAININVDSYFTLHPNVTLQISRSASGPVTQNFLTENRNYDGIILQQNIRIGDPSSLAMQFWMQLHMLDSIKEDIIRYQESQDSNDLVYSLGATRDTKLAAIKEEILQLISDVQIIENENEQNGPKEIDEAIDSACSRPQAEITDQLWTSLKWCGSYDDLLAAINYLFVSIIKHDVVNIPSSKNALAVFIREICERRLAMPALKGTEPLELLVEIGLEKLERDYLYIFTEIGFCTKDEFDAFMNINESTNAEGKIDFTVRKTLASVNGAPRATSARKTLMHSRPNEEQAAEAEAAGLQNSVFNVDKIDRKMAKLAQVHLILEHMLCIRTNLQIKNLYTRTTFLSDVKQSAMPFSEVKNKKIDKREIAISDEEILVKIDNEKPQSLRIVLSSENEMLRVRNTFFYSVLPIFPPEAFPCMNGEVTAGSRYFSHQLLDLSSRHA